MFSDSSRYNRNTDRPEAQAGQPRQVRRTDFTRDRFNRMQRPGQNEQPIQAQQLLDASTVIRQPASENTQPIILSSSGFTTSDQQRLNNVARRYYGAEPVVHTLSHPDGRIAGPIQGSQHTQEQQPLMSDLELINASTVIRPTSSERGYNVIVAPPGLNALERQMLKKKAEETFGESAMEIQMPSQPTSHSLDMVIERERNLQILQANLARTQAELSRARQQLDQRAQQLQSEAKGVSMASTNQAQHFRRRGAELSRARQQLDQRAQQLQAEQSRQAREAGDLETTRNALGITQAQLDQRAQQLQAQLDQRAQQLQAQLDQQAEDLQAERSVLNIERAHMNMSRREEAEQSRQTRKFLRRTRTRHTAEANINPQEDPEGYRSALTDVEANIRRADERQARRRTGDMGQLLRDTPVPNPYQVGSSSRDLASFVPRGDAGPYGVGPDGIPHGPRFGPVGNPDGTPRFGPTDPFGGLGGQW